MTMGIIGTASVGNVTRHLGSEIRFALDITLSTRHQIPADGSAVTAGSRDHRSSLQGNFGCGDRFGRRRGRHRCVETSTTVKTAIDIALIEVTRADGTAVTAGRRDYRWLVQGSFGT